MTKKTVVINGTVYDHSTGMPLRAERGQDNPRRHAAQSVHASLQKSKTLNRKYVRLEKKQVKEVAATAHQSTPVKVKTPATQEAKPAATPAVLVRRKAPNVPSVTVARSPQIHRFAKSAAPTPKKAPTMQDIAPAPHHLLQKVAAHSTKPVARAVKPSQILKQEALHHATNAMPSKRAKDVKQPHITPLRRVFSVMSGAFALLLLGGYFTYLNMPAISTRVAAAQAGINANYPAYRPSGYSLSGPVAYQQGNVTMKFAANAGPQTYTVSQTKSGWDSSAVLENYVSPKTGDDYTTNSVNGLTIYTYGGNAAWVNGGILYTITGDAPLSPDQIERIATSM